MMSIWPKWKVAVKQIEKGDRDRGWALVVFGVLLALFLGVGCRPAPPVVKIGLVAPFEGAERAVGYDALYSARLAVRELNAQGGIGGVRVALVAVDDGGDGRLAAETAAALAADPALIAVVGHGLPHTTAVGQAVYTAEGVPFLLLLAPAEPNPLSAEFIARYEAITPFDETPGPYAGPTYEAFQQLWAAMHLSHEQEGAITRASLGRWLEGR